MKIVYISYGILTATRAHNLQTVNTIDALVERGHVVTFINPLLPFEDSSAQCSAQANLPRCRTVILPAGRFFWVHKEHTLKGRFWSLFLDRSVFALRSLPHLRAATPDVVVTRDLVVCLWLLVFKWLIRVPVVYELHTLEQVMFDVEDVESTTGDPIFARRVRAVTDMDFAGHQDDPSWLGGLYKRFISRIENWTVRKASLVLVLTAAMARRLRSDFAVAESRVVPSGHPFGPAQAFDKQVQRAKLGLKPKLRIAMYSGLSLHGKGLDLLFGVARHLPPDCMIVVLGEEPGISARLTALGCELDLSQLVFLPRVPHEQVADYLRAADLGLLLYPRSRYLAEFSSPMKLFEYLACGLPVIATAIPALQEIVVDGVNGRFVSPEDPKAVAELIVATARDHALLERLGAAARACSVRYHYEQRARRIEEAILDCVRSRTAAGESRCFST